MPIPSMGGFLGDGHFRVIPPDEGVACFEEFLLVSLCHFFPSFLPVSGISRHSINFRMAHILEKLILTQFIFSKFRVPGLMLERVK